MTSRRASFARRQRKTAGLAEQKVWSLLRGGQIDGHKFRRQHPVGRYIADFACDKLRLIVEIDGGVHDRHDVVANDRLRQTALEDLGWTVLRFSNDVALGGSDQIVQAIRKHAAELDLDYLTVHG
jgi:very-short-patch-repair endonuclease